MNEAHRVSWNGIIHLLTINRVSELNVASISRRDALLAVDARLTDGEKLAELVLALFKYVEIFDGPIKKEVERLSRLLAPVAPSDNGLVGGAGTVSLFTSKGVTIIADDPPLAAGEYEQDERGHLKPYKPKEGGE